MPTSRRQVERRETTSIARRVAAVMRSGYDDGSEEFEDGLDLILDGLEKAADVG